MTALAISLPAQSAVEFPTATTPFNMVIKGQQIHLDDDKSVLIDKLGEPASDSAEQTTWRFDNGLTLIAVLNQDKLLEATLSSSAVIEDSFIMINGEANYLNTQTIDELEEEYQATYRCLSYFEQDGLGWMDYMIQDANNNDFYATFSAINRSKHSLTTLDGKLATKMSLVDSITLRQGQESFSTPVYCKNSEEP